MAETAYRSAFSVPLLGSPGSPMLLVLSASQQQTEQAVAGWRRPREIEGNGDGGETAASQPQSVSDIPLNIHTSL